MFKKMLLVATILYSFQSYASVVYDCRFTSYSNPEKVTKIRSTFDLKIVSDDKNNMHYLVGNNGSSKVERVNNLYGVNFIEITESGNITITTISVNGNAVHSRNTIMAGSLIPTQYYGSCAIQ